jgi:hypothetical protein
MNQRLTMFMDRNKLFNKLYEQMNLLKILKINFAFNTENVLVLLGQDFVKLNPNWLSRVFYKVLNVSRITKCGSRDGTWNPSPNHLFT